MDLKQLYVHLTRAELKRLLKALDYQEMSAATNREADTWGRLTRKINAGVHKGKPGPMSKRDRESMMDSHLAHKAAGL